MRFTEENLRELKELFYSSVNELLKNDSFMSQVINTVKEHFIAEIEELKKECDTFKKENRYLSDKLDELEQYTRRNNVRVFGISDNVQDVESEVLSLFNNKLSVPVKVEDIDRCHRVGAAKKTNNGSRAIIVKFVSYRTRDLVCKARKRLKGSKIGIQEDLTSKRYKLLQLARERVGNGNAWSRDGAIKIHVNNRICTIKNANDIEDPLTKASRLSLA
ncbi:uncharacterized protein [Onthophagus taurus]|uniref:uncharacterized protein n=1 Tax=Onthophagus taurus TaxID=166361 RepID=UPI0039BE2440